MHTGYPSEKASLTRRRDGNKSKGRSALVIFQQVLAFSSGYVLASEIYMFVTGVVTPDLLPTAIVLMTSAGTSLLYIGLHGATALLTPRAHTKRKETLRRATQWLATSALRLAVTVWLAACGMNITFTLARQPYCIVDKVDTGSHDAATNTGTTCVVQRSGIAAGLLALLASCALFVLLHKTSEPFRCHLFGVAKEPALLPLMLPYKASGQRAMFSEMSFKCRSSTSLSSCTLVPSTNTSTTHLLPTCPEKAVIGLGIYAPKAYRPSFLTPRPSLSSIRTHTTMRSLPPPCPPLPRLLAHSAMHKAVHPPRPSRPSRTHSEKTVRIVPPSPALSRANLAVLNRSESLSSVYSRSISGEGPGPRPIILSDSSRSISSGSTATVVKSPLCAMRRADDPDTILTLDLRSRTSSDSSDSDIDDTAMLQAKLPSVMGEMETWQPRRQNHTSYYQRARELDREGTMRRLEFTPLTIRKTRDSAALFQNNIV
ncbi:hypothetical protein LTR36_004390 [Oleoguttula mirabilis]|uniref:Uncharacterized protein n=1 Tax=Oleoguttula mirabilis TaxID=1507867 RepID=A0AAV9JGA7_9PEZI|nr:hypothetical protein LTR36_004390 [Oleoguttula mirabilis]